MIGNDIVDLNVASVESNWQRKGFLNKIFTEEEQRVILNSENSFQSVWLFWSMKESAYKIYIRKHKNRFFAPKKFICKLVSEVKGIVFIDQESYPTSSIIDTKYIFTQATMTNDANLDNSHFKVKNKSHQDDSKKAYKQLKETVSKKLNIPIIELQLKKDKIGIPKLYHNRTPLEVSFSLSHHGKYGAYSLLNTL